MTPQERLDACRKALDEEARLANAATPGPWYVQPNDLIGGWCLTVEDAPPSSGPREVADFGDEGDTRHIASHDPATVLRHIAAGRAMCDEYERHLRRYVVTAAVGYCGGCRLFTLWSEGLLGGDE